MDARFYTELDALLARGGKREIEDFLNGELRVAERSGDPTAAVTILNELLGFYRIRHEYDDCRACCERILEALERIIIDEEADLGTVYLNVATAYREMQDYEVAEKLFKKVHDIYSNTLDPSDFRMATLYNNFSLLYQAQHRFDESYAFLKKAIEALEMSHGTEIQVAISYTNMGCLFMDHGRYEEARESLEKATEMFEQNDGAGTPPYSNALIALGDLYSLQKDDAKALDYYTRAANVIRNCLGKSVIYDDVLARIDATKAKLGI